MKLGVNYEKYIGSRVLSGKEVDLHCWMCKRSLHELDVFFYCSQDRLPLCFEDVRSHIVIYAHEDIKVDRIEVEK